VARTSIDRGRGSALRARTQRVLRPIRSRTLRLPHFFFFFFAVTAGACSAADPVGAAAGNGFGCEAQHQRNDDQRGTA
jgi:hypothetical protein